MSSDKEPELPPELYQQKKCNWCDGARDYEHGREICTGCAGTGFRLTALGEAIWELATRAARRERREA